MKKIVLFSLACMLAFAMLLSGCAAPAAEVPTYTGTGTTQTSVTLRIVTMEGEKLFDGAVKVVDDNPTVYMALKAAADSAKITLEVVDEATPDSMFLNGINDLVSENPNYWMFYVNKEMAAMGMGTQAIANDDVVEFIYGDYNNGYVEVK